MRFILFLTFLASVSACSAQTSVQPAPTPQVPNQPSPTTTPPVQTEPSKPSTSVTSPNPPSSQTPLISACTNDVITQGIDVSDNQENTDWPKVAVAGVHFSFVKATQGITFISSSFSKDWAAAKSANIIRGAYHYFMASDDPDAQAETFLKTVGSFPAGDLPPMLDWEESFGETPQKTIAAAQRWLDDVKKASGKTPIIYTSPQYWKSIGSPAGFEQYPLFVVDMSGHCPEIPAPWKQWTFWQYHEATVSGINGKTDLDAFNGSIADIIKLTQ